MVWVRVAFHENDGHHENDENDKDNLHSYKQGVQRWIRGNHGNHENDENHGNPGCKPRVPQTTGLEIPEISICGKFDGNFAGFFWTHQLKAQEIRGKFLSIFHAKLRRSKNIFRANFVLQTCRPNNYSCDPSDHLQESPGPLGPKSQKSLTKSLFGGLQKSPRKYPKKSKNTRKNPILGIFRLFRVFSGTFLQTPKKTLFETSLGFRAQRARRLL